MSEAGDDTPIPSSPLDRVMPWDQLLRRHGWSVGITWTAGRARLDAAHPSGAAVMVTAGIAGRASSGRTHLYALNPPGLGVPDGWLGVKAVALQEFAARPVQVAGRRIPSKCSCRTGNGRGKLRYPTEHRARLALVDTAISRSLHGVRKRAECRAYRCPDDDRAWHLSSQAVWLVRPDESPLWTGDAQACA